jgi:hypothetical protein
MVRTAKLDRMKVDRVSDRHWTAERSIQLKKAG